MSNASQFLSMFNQVEDHLRKLHGGERVLGFKVLVRELSKSNSMVLSFKDDLTDFADLRNAIVHRSTDKPIAEPYPETLDRIKGSCTMY